MVAKPKNDDEAAAMRAALSSYDRERAAARQAESARRVKPLLDVVTSKVFRDVRDKLEALQGDFAGDDAINVHLAHLPGFMRRLAAAAEAAVAPAPDASPVPPSADGKPA